MERPEYYGILPSKVRYDERLKPMEKIIFSELTALVRKKGYCYASNMYFATLYGVHKSTVSAWISNLAKCGHITTKCIMKDKRVEERRIYIADESDISSFPKLDKEKSNTVDDKILDEILEEKAERREKTPEELEDVRKKLLRDLFGCEGE